MTMTDPIADMLTRLRNANNAYHDTVSMPSSKLKVNIASMLKNEGYIAGYEVADAAVGKTLTLSLKYGANRQRAIQGLKRVSKPGLALYGCALAWSCLASVLLPYETLAPGDSPMRSRTSGTAFLAALIQMAAILLLLAVCSPVLGVAVYGVVQGAPVWGWVALVAGVVWCGLLLWGGVVFGGRALDRRGPQVLATIRTWPGHSQPV